jgi:hypothetical protein
MYVNMKVWGDTYPFISVAEVIKIGTIRTGRAGRHGGTEIRGETVVELHLVSVRSLCYSSDYNRIFCDSKAKLL